MIVLNQGKALAPGDLGINVRDARGQLVDPALIQYSIFQKAPDGTKVLASPPLLVPERASTGVYYVGGGIPSNWEGEYLLIWYLRQFQNDREVQVDEEFSVVRIDPATTSFEAPSVLLAKRPGLNPRLVECIIKVRELLSDENPERNYFFRPPTPGKEVAGFNNRVGFIWTDQTIIRMLRLAMQQANSWNPRNRTEYTVENAPEAFREAIAVGAASWCLGKEAARWAEEEMSYSLNGVSLDLHKAQTYQSLAQEYSAEFKEWLPLLTEPAPCSKGVRQQRWLLG